MEHASCITSLDELARNTFLTRYTGYTQKLYESDLRIYFSWCEENKLSPLATKRPHLEQFIAYMLTVKNNKASSVRRRIHALKGFYALAVDDELIQRDPTRLLRLPRGDRDPERLVWLDRFQVGAFLHEAKKTSPAHHALIGLMAIGGLRVSAACNARIEDLSVSPYGAISLRVKEKGSRIHTLDVPPQLAEIIYAAAEYNPAGGVETAVGNGSAEHSQRRTEGPIVLKRNGQPQDRNGAYAWVRLLGEKIGIPRVHPHAFRRAAITAVIDGGGSIQDACAFAGHAEISTTERYHPTRGARGTSGSFLTAAAFSVVG